MARRGAAIAIGLVVVIALFRARDRSVAAITADTRFTGARSERFNDAGIRTTIRRDQVAVVTRFVRLLDESVPANPANTGLAVTS